MRPTIFLFFFLTSISIFGQSKSLKIYSNFLLLGSERYKSEPIFIATRDNNNGFEFEQITIAFRKEKEKRFWEYEAGFLMFSEEDSINQLDHFDVHFRVEKGYQLKESSNGKFKFYLSPAAKAYYWKEEDIPKNTIDEFPITNWLGGINLTIFLRGEYHFSEQWHLDLNISFFGSNFGVDFQKIENPILTDRQQTQGGYDFDIRQERILRIGLGYTFKKSKT